MGLTRRINPGFVAKRGKLRRVAKRPASKKCLEYKSVKYVRGERDLPPAGVRLDRVHWKRTVPELLKATDRQIVQILQQDKMLPKWHGKVCPHCQRGHLQEKLRYGKPHYRCRAKGCQRYVSPQYLHPFFTSCLGPQATSLQLQSATLFMLLTGCSFPQVHLALGINHKAIEDMFARIATARQAYVVEKQKSIVFGHEKSWVDVEADEATFQRTNVSKDVEYKDSAQTGKPILWEQWSGIMVRGKPSPSIPFGAAFDQEPCSRPWCHSESWLAAPGHKAPLELPRCPAYGQCQELQGKSERCTSWCRCSLQKEDTITMRKEDPMEISTVCQGSKPQAPEWKDLEGEGGHTAHRSCLALLERSPSCQPECACWLQGLMRTHSECPVRVLDAGPRSLVQDWGACATSS